MSKLKRISGYRGVSQYIEAGGIQFFIVAATVKDVEKIYNHILEDAEQFTPETCNKVVIVSASDLPEDKTKIATDEKPQA